MYLAFLHPAGGLGKAIATLEHTVIKEYIPFIMLLFSLYTISGGIRISGDLPAPCADQQCLHRRRRPAGQLHRDHRRRHAADSSPA